MPALLLSPDDAGLLLAEDGVDALPGVLALLEGVDAFPLPVEFDVLEEDVSPLPAALAVSLEGCVVELAGFDGGVEEGLAVVVPLDVALADVGTSFA